MKDKNHCLCKLIMRGVGQEQSSLGEQLDLQSLFKRSSSLKKNPLPQTLEQFPSLTSHICLPFHILQGLDLYNEIFSTSKSTFLRNSSLRNNQRIVFKMYLSIKARAIGDYTISVI